MNNLRDLGLIFFENKLAAMYSVVVQLPASIMFLTSIAKNIILVFIFMSWLVGIEFDFCCLYG